MSDARGRGRILVLDDDPRERAHSVEALGQGGYVVDTATTKAEVITFLGRHEYDLVLSDLKMPGLNGPTLYQVLKESCRGATPPVIFLLHKGYTPEYANFLMRLAAPVLMKPVRAADLRQAVERLVPAPRAASTVGS